MTGGNNHPTMRVLSDIHVDVNEPRLVRIGHLSTDINSVLVLAGDYGSPKKFADWLKIVADPFLHVVAILGNHDYWGMSVEKAPEKWRESLAKHLPESLFSRVSLLERDTADILGIRFIGTTLWTDYEHGDPYSMRAAQEVMQDHKRIRVRGGTQRFLPSDALQCHLDSLHWLENEIKQPWNGPKVIVSHHAPLWRSLSHLFRTDEISGAYASRLDDTISNAAASGVRLWVHGHTHHAVDYTQDDLRILSNPYGYQRESTGVSLNQRIVL